MKMRTNPHRGLSDGWDWSEGDGWSDVVARGIGASAPICSGLVPTGKVLIVEAKLKSLPRLDQLEVYDQKLRAHPILLSYPDDGSRAAEWKLRVDGQDPDVGRCLLSLGGQPLVTSLQPWPGASWSALQAGMNQCMSALRGHVLARTLTDYVSSLGAVIAIVGRTNQLCLQARHPAVVPYRAVLCQPLDQQLRQLRVADLLGKTLFDSWLTEIRIEVRAACPCPLPTGWSLNDYVHYSNGMPGLGVEFRRTFFQTNGPENERQIWDRTDGTENELQIGVQLQGREFRLYVSVTSAWAELEKFVVKNAVLWQGWFATPIAGSVPTGARGAPIGPVSGQNRLTNLKVFNANKFIYSGSVVSGQTFATVEAEIVRIMAHCSTLLSSI